MRRFIVVMSVILFVVLAGCAQTEKVQDPAQSASPALSHAPNQGGMDTQPGQQATAPTQQVTQEPLQQPSQQAPSEDIPTLNQCCLVAPGNCQSVQSGRCHGGRLLACDQPICHSVSYLR